MNIISIIPARGESNSIPKKNIITVYGKPLIGWTIEQSINTKIINYTFVTTDNDEIAEISARFGAKVIKRPESISGDMASAEALIHALEFVRSNYQFEPDLIVFLQATSPLRKQDDISNCIKKLIDEESDSIFSGCFLEDFLIWENVENKWQSFNFDYLNRGMRQQRKPQFVENGSIYVFKPSILTNYNNRLGGKISLFEMEFWQIWGMDNPCDIEIVESFMKFKLKNKYVPEISLKDIDLIVYDFDGVMTDNTAFVDEDGNESVRVNRADGLAISYFKKKGINQLILSTEKNKVVQKRAEKLQIDCFNNIDNKKDFLLGYAKDHNVSLNKVLYLGNDINDLESMLLIGIPVCPKDAVSEIISISKLVLEKNGGHGVIRNLYEYLK